MLGFLDSIPASLKGVPQFGGEEGGEESFPLFPRQLQYPSLAFNDSKGLNNPDS